MFAPYLNRWSLIADGEPIITHSSRLLPVLWQDRPAMLKVAADIDERYGALLMQWWDGDGAAYVYAQEGDAVLLERATGKRSLLAMAMNGEDDEASRILCATAARLHAPRKNSFPIPSPLLAGSAIWSRQQASMAARLPIARRSPTPSLPISVMSPSSTATSTTTISSISRHAAGWQSIRSGSMASAASISPISSPTRNCLSSPIPPVYAASSPSSQQRRNWSRSGCCNGSPPIPVFPPPGSSVIRIFSRQKRP